MADYFYASIEIPEHLIVDKVQQAIMGGYEDIPAG